MNTFEEGMNVFWFGIENEPLPGEISQVSAELLMCKFRGGAEHVFGKDGYSCTGEGYIHLTSGEYLRFLKKREKEAGVFESELDSRHWDDIESVDIYSVRINDIVVLHTVNPIDTHTLNMINNRFDAQLGFHVTLINLKPGADLSVIKDGLQTETEELQILGYDAKLKLVLMSDGTTKSLAELMSKEP